ncbi:glycerol-3-phosphate dehydrogenase/oxidase [Aureitalea marina]|uniref:FAD-dependent oxidoreductase n=1 Tax=Aureitalea marina TaxID=930804 RepID=A0A2S7KMS6_9FLAO|nr:glycerol-3-phosphate dehydrogenase/oxidase [Aureitalea marina]PQB03934.1 FAD-dependent oxidoreductase [Aureitalea marina]
MNREEQLLQLSNCDQWDFIVIGGGASGLGAAVDAASRGFKTVLFEGVDFAKGTSSRSTKLVHGGVRYLAQGDIGLVREALKERGVLAQNAGHLFQNQEFVIPTYSHRQKWFYGIGLKVYDWLSLGWSLGRSRLMGRSQVSKLLPNIRKDGLNGGVLYRDGQFDDARLALNLAQTAIEAGGTVINYMKVIDFLKDDDRKICGVRVQDMESGAQHEVRSRVVINATGVFSNKILKMDDRKANEIRVVPSQGIHLVVDASFLGADQALMIPKTTDGRVLFAIPWHGRTLLGTTDTLIKKPSYEPEARKEEIDFILENAGQYLEKAPQRSDVLSVFAGLRPLVAPKKDKENTKEISRGHKILTSPSGLITILGGKWTTYRSMGRELIDKALHIHDLRREPSNSRQIGIHGNPNGRELPLDPRLRVYGQDAFSIQEMEKAEPESAQRLHPYYPYTKAQLIWAVNREMARTVEDFLARRIRLLFLDAEAAIQAAPLVSQIMAQQLNKEQDWVEQQLRDFTKLAKGYQLEH